MSNIVNFHNTASVVGLVYRGAADVYGAQNNAGGVGVKRLFWLLGAVALPLSVLHAQEAPSTGAQELPSYSALSCEGACPTVTPARRVTGPHVTYDGATMQGEGVVDVSFTIGTDGHVKDPIVEQATGGGVFIKAAEDALAHDVYEPATENGKPVEANRQMRFMYVPGAAGLQENSRPSTEQAYKDAVAKQSDPAAAIAALKAIGAQGGLNLHEAAMVSGAQAQIEATSGDIGDAVRDSQKAVIDGGGMLNAEESEQQLRLNIILEARAGQYANAFPVFEALKHVAHGVPDDAPEARLIAGLHADLASSKPLWSNAKITDPPDGVWTHTMLRRSFGFANIKGAIGKFHLRCDTHGIEAAVNDSSTWTIPASWSGCIILVEGTPGTTFQFGEAPPAAAAK